MPTIASTVAPALFHLHQRLLTRADDDPATSATRPANYHSEKHPAVALLPPDLDPEPRTESSLRAGTSITTNDTSMIPFGPATVSCPQ